MRSHTLGLVLMLAAGGCMSTAATSNPVERVDEGIYRVAIVGGANGHATRREVASEWDRTARETCAAGYEVLEDNSTSESGDTVGLNVLGVPVAPGGVKTVNAKSGFIRCDDSPYGLADASFIVREMKTVVAPPANLEACTGTAANGAVALRTRAEALLEAEDLAGAFACFYRAASFGTDFRDGDAEAQFQVARAYERGVGTAASPMLALMWYRRAAVNGHEAAAFRLTELAPTEPVH